MTTNLQLIRVKPAVAAATATFTRKRRPADSPPELDALDVERQSPTGTRRRHHAATADRQTEYIDVEDKSGKRSSKLHKLLHVVTEFVRNARYSPRWLLLTIVLLTVTVPALVYYHHPAALSVSGLQQLAHNAISSEVSGLLVFTVLHSSHSLQPLQITAIHSWHTYLTSLHNIVLVTESSAICGTYQEVFPGIRCLSITQQCLTLPQHSPLAQCMLQELEQIAARLDKQYVSYIDSTTVVYDEVNAVFNHVIQQSTASSKAVVGVSNSYTLGISTEGVVPATLIEPQYLASIRSQASALNSRSLDSIDLMLWRANAVSLRQMPMSDYDTAVWQRWLLRQAMIQPEVSTVNFGDAIAAVTQRLSGASNLHVQQHTRTTWPLDELVQQQLKIASIDNVQTLCQRSADLTGFLTVDQPQVRSHATLFAQHASSGHTLTVLPVDQHTLPDAMNWLCWAQRIEFTSYVLHAQDQAAYEALRAAGHPVLEGSVDTDVYETILNVHSSGYHALLASPQAIWFSSPLPYIEQLHASYVGTSDASGATLLEQPVLSMYKATSAGRRLVSAIARCRSEKHDANQCLHSSVHSMSLNTPAEVHSLHQSPQFPSYSQFFVLQMPQQHGHMPVVVSTGSDDKQRAEKLQQWQLQAYDSSSQQCLTTANVIAATSSTTTLHPTLTLRIIASNKPLLLQQLMTTLQQIDYAGDTVNMVLSVDHPLPTPTAADVESWTELINIARNVTWPHGAYNVIEHVEHVGTLGQYVKSWSPNDLNQVTLFLKEDSVVSPHYYTWVKQSVQQYYADSTQRQSRMYGMLLSPTDEIYGETNDHRYGSRHVSSELQGDLPLYKYQLAQPHGLLWFPQHFQAFQQWLSTKRVDLTHGISVGSAGATACIPTMVTNFEWQLQPSQHWSQWINRFAYEHGLYALHTNFRDGALVTTADQSRSLLVTRELPPSYTSLTTLSALPLYDFHFLPVHNAVALSYRGFAAPSQQFDQCWTLHQLTEKIDVEKRAAAEQQRLAQPVAVGNTASAAAAEHEHHVHEPVDDQAQLLPHAHAEHQSHEHDDHGAPAVSVAKAVATKAPPASSKSKPSAKSQTNSAKGRVVGDNPDKAKSKTGTSDKKAAAKSSKSTPKPSASQKKAEKADSKVSFDVDAAIRQLTVSKDKTSTYKTSLQQAAKLKAANVKALFSNAHLSAANTYVNRVARYAQPLTAISKGFQKSSYLTINDGLGFGALAVLLQNTTNVGASITASDITLETLQLSHSANLLHQPPKQLDPHQLKVTPNTVDFLTAHNLWQTVAKPSDAVHEMLRVARKGVVIIDCHETMITTELPSELFATSDFDKSDNSVQQMDAMQMLMLAQQQKVFIAYRAYYSTLDAAYSNNEVKEGRAACKPLAVLMLKKQPTKYQLSLLTQAHWLMPVVKTPRTDSE